MAKKIGKRDAGRGLSAGHSDKSAASYEELWVAARKEIDGLRSTVTALLQKMDADFADVTNASTDYEATVTLPAKEFEE